MRQRITHALFAGAAFFLILSSGAGATDLPAPDYAGQVQPLGHVAFRVVSADGQPASVRFDTNDFEFRCEDGSRYRTDFNVRKAEFTAPGVFEYADGPDTSYYRIHGRLLPNGSARGFVFAYSNSLGDPECSTSGGIARWSADPVSSADRMAPRSRVWQAQRNERIAMASQRRGDYEGSVVYQRESQIKLDISRATTRAEGRLKASGVTMQCNDTTYQKFDLRPVTLHFDGRSAFHGDTVVLQDSGAVRSVVTIVGRVSWKKRRASGDVMAYENPMGRPGSDIEPECALGRAHRWRARLVR
jgi:hypothetical protein